jgi:NADH-quinone oxidoreductase subunit L
MVNAGAALLLIPLLPLAAGLVAHLFLRRAPQAAAWTGIASLLASAAFAAQLMGLALHGSPVHWEVPWINSPDIQIPLALDAGLAQLLFIITAALLAAGVLLYALRERQGDPRAAAFHASLTLFAGSMLVLLCADTLLLVYLAWEVLGLFSFILIAHTGTDEARRAARQAFWTTRATDIGLLFAVLILMTKFGWMTLSGVDVAHLAAQVSDQTQLAALLAWLGAVGLLTLAAVIGKSAQWPLSFWLADAMAAPAPVSALLHAATLVAAGPYLLVRFVHVIDASQPALLACTLAGGLTLVLGGAMALAARDPKRILAYSTVSQLGLVICGVGLVAEEAAYFHLLAHAWCKAALFLAVGYLAARRHAGAEAPPPTLRELAGTARRNPAALWTLLLGAASLGGVPLLAGALGKEQLLWAAWTRSGAEPSRGAILGKALPLAAHGWPVAGVLIVLSLPLTAAYFTRLVGVLGWGGPAVPADGQHAPPGEVPAPTAGWGGALGAALGFAVVGSLGWAAAFAWFKQAFGADSLAWKWAPEPAALLTAGAALVLAAGGGFAAWSLSVRRGGPATASQPPNAFTEFFAAGMRLREFWHEVVAVGGLWLAVLAGRTETNVIERLTLGTGRFGRSLAAAAAWTDRHVVDGARWQVTELAWRVRRLHAKYLQTGDLQHYMFVILLGAVVLCIVVIRPLSHIFAKMLQFIQE